MPLMSPDPSTRRGAFHKRISQGALDSFIACQNAPRAEHIRLAVKPGYKPSGLLDHDDTRGHVPGLQVAFPETIEPSSCEPWDMAAGIIVSRGTAGEFAGKNNQCR